MLNQLTFVYLSAEHSYVLESSGMEFVQRTDLNADRSILIDSLEITKFPCLVMLSYDDAEGDNPKASTLPISLLRCEEPEVEYEEEETDGNLRAGNPESYLAFD